MGWGLCLHLAGNARSSHGAWDRDQTRHGPGAPVFTSNPRIPGWAPPNLCDLLQQIATNHGGDDVSRRVAQAACGSDTSGADHSVDDEDDSDSVVSLRCGFVDSMAAGRVAQRAIG